MMKMLAVALATLGLLQLNAWGDDQLHQRAVYTLHIGDEISLNYRFTPEFNQTVTVQPDGSVVLNIVGSVRLAGLTLIKPTTRSLSWRLSNLTIRSCPLPSPNSSNLMSWLQVR